MLVGRALWASLSFAVGPVAAAEDQCHLGIDSNAYRGLHVCAMPSFDAPRPCSAMGPDATAREQKHSADDSFKK